MQQPLTLKLTPAEAGSDDIIRHQIAVALQLSQSRISGYHIIKRSLDARGRKQWIQLTLNVFIDETFTDRLYHTVTYQDVSSAKKKVIVVGAGPAGLFAALRLIEKGIQPIVLERGKDVRARRRDLAALNKEGVLNPESNYCFGEGGAGTYSDGKLYTRSTKRGDVQRILSIFIAFGADEEIFFEAHPHIGTNKLPHIITEMRHQIVAAGGKFMFGKKVTFFNLSNNCVTGVQTSDGDTIEGDAVILATGHSARDIFELLHQQNITIEAKPFALGVRIEHPQQLIDSIQYHADHRNIHLPPAAYSLVQQVEERGVFSFCMCPGGIIAPASTAPNELVVNGWSPSKRNNPYANSGIVVAVEEKDIKKFLHQHGPLGAMEFQRSVETNAYNYGGGNFVAPAQCMADFVERKNSSTFPPCSYIPGISPAKMNEVLPSFIYEPLRRAFIEFGKKMKGYFTNEAVIVATESRTSSPVRIPRDFKTLQHPNIQCLFPCGEGAGYAGGIVSAAMDGERVADAVANKVKG